MTDSVAVAIGVFDGKVIAKWHAPVDQITFDPKNAYTVGLALSKAALEAHRGSSVNGDADFVAGQLTEQRITITDAQRDLLIGKVATMLKTFIDQGKWPGYIAMHAVDLVLSDTAR